MNLYCHYFTGQTSNEMCMRLADDATAITDYNNVIKPTRDVEHLDFNIKPLQTALLQCGRELHELHKCVQKLCVLYTVL